MNELVRQKLCEVIASYGVDICNTPGRFGGLLCDFCGEHRREVNVLVAALNERVVEELRVSENGLPRSLLLARLSRRLQDNLAISVDAADWAVESWALALGVISSPSEWKPSKASKMTPKRTAKGSRAAAKPKRAKTPKSVTKPERAKMRKSVTKPERTGRSKSTTRITPVPEAEAEPSMADESGTVVVSQTGKGQYKSIASALKWAGPGTRILVRRGKYREPLVLKKPVEIVGASVPEGVVVEVQSNTCIKMRTDYAIIRGIAVSCKSPETLKHCAVEVTRGKLVLESCSVTSTTSACMRVNGRGANPVLRGCAIRGSEDSGILFGSKASGSISGCDVQGSKGSGILITGGSRPRIERCKIHKSDVGITVHAGSPATVDGCDITRNSAAGVEIRKGRVQRAGPYKVVDQLTEVSDRIGDAARTVQLNVRGYTDSHFEVDEANCPRFLGCDIHDMYNTGVIVGDGGEALLSDCNIYRNAVVGVVVGSGGSLKLMRCKVHNSNESGIWIRKHGRCMIHECLVSDNVNAGVWIARGGTEIIDGGEISDPVVREQSTSFFRRLFGDLPRG